MGTTVSELARQLLELAKNGLLRRAKTAFGIDESALLKPLERTLELNETPAERIRSAFAASQSNSKGGGLEAFLWEWAREANQKPDHLR
jgi:gamma-glutamylcysteine synthetase